MSRRGWYIAGFVGCIVLAVVMAFTFEDPNQGWKIMLIMGAYGTGMYFQGRWHELEG